MCTLNTFAILWAWTASRASLRRRFGSPRTRTIPWRKEGRGCYIGSDLARFTRRFSPTWTWRFNSDGWRAGSGTGARRFGFSTRGGRLSGRWQSFFFGSTLVQGWQTWARWHVLQRWRPSASLHTLALSGTPFSFLDPNFPLVLVFYNRKIS